MKTEAFISKERAQAQQYLDVAGVMIAVLDKTGKINFINKKGCQILGYDENEILHQNWFDLCIHDDIREDIVGVFNELMTGNIEPVEDFENPIITKSGEKKIIAFHNTLIMDDDSNITGILFSGEDITERKRVEEEIRLHAAMMDNVAEGVYLIGLDDLLIKWTNEKFTRMFGYDPGEMVGKHVDIVNAPTERTPTETRISIVDVLKETGEWHGEVRNIKRDGTHFWCYANVSLFDHPEYGMVIVSVHTDITERKRVEAELLLKDLVFEHSIAANSISDNTGIIIHVNDTFIRILGYESRNEVIGKPISDFLRFEDEAKKIITTLDETGKWKGEYTALRKNGTTFSAYGLATIILDESGDFIGYQSSVLDITERKQDEEKLKASEDKYSTLVEKGNDGIIIIQDFVLKFVNSRMIELTGFTKEEVIGKPFYDYVSSEYKEMLVERVKKRLKGEAVPGKYEIDILSKDGSIIPVEINASLIEYEGRPADMAIIRDITERLQTEKELQERINELETFYRTTLGREERVIELKQEVNGLLEQLGKNNKYRDYS